MSTTMELIEDYNACVMKTYGWNPIVMVKGKGSWVWDNDGKKYLDFFPGWAVSGLGHCHPGVVKAIKKQASSLIHMPNNFMTELQPLLAKKIIQHAYPGKCFFCNSGAEANEAALKLVRKYGNLTGRYEIITMKKSFHGRTIAAITATGQEKYREGFGPLVPGFKYVEFGNIEALKNAVTEKTVAVMLEPVQGEGGINVAGKSYMESLKAICDEKNLLLIFDEIQTGMGRTGQMFAYKHFGIVPDIMTLAKTLGGGVPIGAILAGKKICDIFSPGDHASTFGGNPLACAAALAVFKFIEENDLLNKVVKQGKYLEGKLEKLKGKYGFIREIRGIGLMLGMELSISGDNIFKKCLEKGLIINCTSGNVLRFVPSMTVTKSEIKTAMKIINEVFSEISEN